jgi:hypothetical protein
MSDTLTLLDQDLTQEDTQDAAWAAVNVPFSPAELRRFCQKDPERLFRINPYLEFTTWEQRPDGRVRFSGRNSSQEAPFEFDLTLRIEPQTEGLTVHYEDGLKLNTRFKVEASEFGAKLTVHEEYRPLTEQDLETYQNEIDRSLTTWAGDLQKFLIMWKQWRWLSPWRWYMNRVWMRLKPTGRRITYMFWWITLVEIALIALGTAIYLLEYT